MVSLTSSNSKHYILYPSPVAEWPEYSRWQIIKSLPLIYFKSDFIAISAGTELISKIDFIPKFLKE